MPSTNDSPYDSEEPLASDSVDPTDLDARLRDAAPVSDNPSGFTDVSLDQINPTDVNSPADFDSPEQYRGMVREAHMLGEMQPTIAQGANADTFDGWDKAHQLGHYSPDGYVRGYVDTYRSYYGDEAIGLDPKADGTYDVLNGRHRIYAAREAGLKMIPAKIV